jgi:hypothetical protein
MSPECHLHRNRLLSGPDPGSALTYHGKKDKKRRDNAIPLLTFLSTSPAREAFVVAAGRERYGINGGNEEQAP